MFVESPYKRYIDDALLNLKERGVIQKLKDIWWKEKKGGGKCGVSIYEDMLIIIRFWDVN